MGTTLISTSTLRMTYRMGRRDGVGNFSDKWPLHAAFSTQPRLPRYVKCSLISRSSIVTKVPRKAVPFGGLTGFARPATRPLEIICFQAKWLME